MLDILVRPDMNAHGREKIFIGRQGENLARRVKFDISEWRKLYGDGSVALVHRRPGDKYPYPCTVVASTDDDCFYWEVTKADVSVFGVGELQLRYYVDDALVKSQIWDSKIDESLDYPLGTKPDDLIEDWIDRVAQAAQEEVDKHLPTCAVTEITGGHRVTITDINKSQSFNVMDGSTGNNGTDGKDGVSPTIVVTDISGGHRVTITDATGTKTFDVMDGTQDISGAVKAAIEEAKPFVVTVLQTNTSDGTKTYTANKTYAEITAAINAGKHCYVNVTIGSGSVLAMLTLSTIESDFVMFTTAMEGDGANIMVGMLFIGSDNKIFLEAVNVQNLIGAVGLLKGSGNGTVSAAVAGTDYVTPESMNTAIQTAIQNTWEASY